MNNAQLYLRKPIPEDAPEMLEWENNTEDWAQSQNSSPYSILDILQLIEDLKDIENVCQARWMICDQETNIIFGAVDLTDIDFENKVAGVGVLIARKEHRNKGLASQAIRMLEKESKLLGIERLLAHVLPNNEASMRLFTKNNFRKIGNSEELYSVDGEYIQAILFEKWLKNS